MHFTKLDDSPMFRKQVCALAFSLFPCALFCKELKLC